MNYARKENRKKKKEARIMAGRFKLNFVWWFKTYDNNWIEAYDNNKMQE